MADIDGVTSSGFGRRDERPRHIDNSENNEDCRAVDALSNYLVLHTIFSNLGNNDLENCCQVNNFWNSVADPLLIRCYDIKLDHAYTARDVIYYSFLAKRATYKTELVIHSMESLEDASNLLATDLETERIEINLRISVYKRVHTINSFLSKIGKLVVKLSVGGFFTSVAFSQLLTRYFPNLRRLDLSEMGFKDDEDHFDENLSRKPMKHLRRIDVHEKEDSYVNLVNLFRIAPNVEEIYDYPIILADALIRTGKASCVKSLTFQRKEPVAIRTNYMYQSDLEKIADLETKLSSFSFEDPYAPPGESLCNVVYRPIMQRILLSSYDSLESLTLCNSETFNFETLPPMHSLKDLTFSVNVIREFFSPEILLSNLFPSVKVVSIPHDFSEGSSLDFATCFPESQFGPWGVQIEKLNLADVSLKALPQLCRLFPCVKSIQFCAGRSSEELKRILRKIGRCWPNMECVNVVVFEYSFGQGCTFDSVFTGIPDDVLDQLRDPLARKENFSSVDVENFKETSTMGTLSRLKILEFILHIRSDHKFIEKLSAVTSISKEFGFEILPELKIVVRTYRDDVFEEVSDLKSSLKTFCNFEAERVVYL